MPKIFISYRRDDSKTITNRIYDRLVESYGKRHVFKDVNSIPAGPDFRGELKKAAANCDIMLVIIGDKWVNIRDKSGNKRLDNPEDFVRLEVETGLQIDGTKVIPVLVNNTSPPNATDLPTSLQQLAFNNAIVVRDDPDFHHDMDQLIAQIGLNRRGCRGWYWRWMIGVLAIPIIAALIQALLPGLVSQSGQQHRESQYTEVSTSNVAVDNSRQSTEILETPIISSSMGESDVLTIYRGRDSVAICSDQLTRTRAFTIEFDTAQTSFRVADLPIQADNNCVCIRDEDQRMTTYQGCIAANTMLTPRLDWLNADIHILSVSSPIGVCVARPESFEIYTCTMQFEQE